MSLSVIPSASTKLSTTKKNQSCRKRRRDQSAEIDELASLVPLSTPQVSNDNPECSLVPSGGLPSAIDKISVLRLTTSFLKLQHFIKNTTPVTVGSTGSVSVINSLMERAMDGFLIVLDKEGNVLYVSETITDYVGLNQQDVIGQNIVDITHADSAGEIADSLKPSFMLTAMPEESTYIVSQFRQFCVKFKSTTSTSSFLSYTSVQITGNLKVNLLPVQHTSRNRQIEIIQPSVEGFVGECRVVKSAASIIELALPHSMFTSTVTLNFKPISIEATVWDLIGYEPEELFSDDYDDDNFIHPADHICIASSKQFLVQTGHSVTPHFRFLTKSGDWIWMQVEGTLQCKSGTSIPLCYEYKIKVLSQGGGRLKYVEQKEVYAGVAKHTSKSDRSRDSRVVSKPANTHNCKHEPVQSVIESLKSTRLPESVLKPALHCRSMAISQHSELVKLLLAENIKASGFGVHLDEGIMQNSFQAQECVSVSPISAVSPAASASPACSTTTQDSPAFYNTSMSLNSPDPSEVQYSLSSLSPLSNQLVSGTPSPSTTSFVRADASPGSDISVDGVPQIRQLPASSDSNLLDSVFPMMESPDTYYNGIQTSPLANFYTSSDSSLEKSTSLLPTQQCIGSSPFQTDTSCSFSISEAPSHFNSSVTRSSWSPSNTCTTQHLMGTVCHLTDSVPPATSAVPPETSDILFLSSLDCFNPLSSTFNLSNNAVPDHDLGSEIAQGPENQSVIQQTLILNSSDQPTHSDEFFLQQLLNEAIPQNGYKFNNDTFMSCEHKLAL